MQVNRTFPRGDPFRQLLAIVGAVIRAPTKNEAVLNVKVSVEYSVPAASPAVPGQGVQGVRTTNWHSGEVPVKVPAMRVVKHAVNAEGEVCSRFGDRDVVVVDREVEPGKFAGLKHQPELILVGFLGLRVGFGPEMV